MQKKILIELDTEEVLKYATKVVFDGLNKEYPGFVNADNKPTMIEAIRKDINSASYAETSQKCANEIFGDLLGRDLVDGARSTVQLMQLLGKALHPDKREGGDNDDE